MPLSENEESTALINETTSLLKPSPTEDSTDSGITYTDNDDDDDDDDESITPSLLESGQRQQRQQRQQEEQEQLLRRRCRVPVEYDGDNHASVLFQMYGSVWPYVLPWCLATWLWTGLVLVLRNYCGIDMTIQNNNGHMFMSLLVSFLVVTRTTITYSRFMEARQGLTKLFLNAREIVQYACVLSLCNSSRAAQTWRQDVAFRVIVCLRMALSAVAEHEHTELILEDAAHQDNVTTTNHNSNNVTTPNSNNINNFWKSLAHGPRTVQDINFRAPLEWAFKLRQKVLETRETDCLETRAFHVNEELKILTLVTNFCTALQDLKKLITTPFPFPLVQMARTFLFFWVFSLPLVLIPDNDQIFEVFVLMFFCTYGFLGLEYVNMELDDPYGEDPNDFCCQYWLEMVLEDIYMTIYQTDGLERAIELRSRITERIAQGGALHNYRHDMVRRSTTSVAAEFLGSLTTRVTPNKRSLRA